MMKKVRAGRLLGMGWLLSGMMVLVLGCAEPKTPVKPAAEGDATDHQSAEAAAPAEPPSSDKASPETAKTEKSADGDAGKKVAMPTSEIEPKTNPAATGSKPKKVLLGSPELTAGIPGEGPLKKADIEAWLADAANHETLEVELPLGLATGAGQIQGLDKNPLTRAKIELGRQLYFDPRLSVDASVSCAHCHDPDEGYAKHTQFGIGVKGQMGGRNSPVSYNRILSGAQFWDGRAESLEAQAIGPIANPIEMGHTHEACITCLSAIPGYKAQFDKVFGKCDINTVGQALASFERAIVTSPSPFDYYEQFRPFESQDPDDLKDDAELFAKYQAAAEGAKAHPLSESARRGRDLFFSDKAGCTACHVGANLTDEKYHNLGIGMDVEKPDIGREDQTRDPKDRGAFKTPTIRNVALSAPYMHDGSVKTLEEVVEWYAKGGHPNQWLSEKIKKLELSDQDKKDLVEFMTQGCTSEFPKVNRGRLPE